MHSKTGQCKDMYLVSNSHVQNIHHQKTISKAALIMLHITIRSHFEYSGGLWEPHIQNETSIFSGTEF